MRFLFSKKRGTTAPPPSVPRAREFGDYSHHTPDTIALIDWAWDQINGEEWPSNSTVGILPTRCVLLVSGPLTNGRTYRTALITQKGMTYQDGFALLAAGTRMLIRSATTQKKGKA